MYASQSQYLHSESSSLSMSYFPCNTTQTQLAVHIKLLECIYCLQRWKISYMVTRKNNQCAFIMKQRMLKYLDCSFSCIFYRNISVFFNFRHSERLQFFHFRYHNHITLNMIRHNFNVALFNSTQFKLI